MASMTELITPKRQVETHSAVERIGAFAVAARPGFEVSRGEPHLHIPRMAEQWAGRKARVKAASCAPRSGS